MSQLISSAEISSSLENIIQKAFIQAERNGSQIIYKNKSGEIAFCEDCYKNNVLYEFEDIIGKIAVCCGFLAFINFQNVDGKSYIADNVKKNLGK